MNTNTRAINSSLTCLFVFNPTLGDEMTEGDKIISFYPPDMDINIQKDFVGLTEGMIAFTKDFSPEAPCEAVHCQKNRHAFFEAEADFWFVLVVKNPVLISEVDGKTVEEYQEDDLEDAVLQALIRRCYHTFRMFNGSLTRHLVPGVNADENGAGLLRERLTLFMKYYVPSVRFGQLPFYTDIEGFAFVPVDRSTFLLVQYLVNLAMQYSPRITHAAVMYEGRLLYSSIGQEDMFVLYSLEQDHMLHLYTYLSLNALLYPEVPGGDGQLPVHTAPQPPPLDANFDAADYVWAEGEGVGAGSAGISSNPSSGAGKGRRPPLADIKKVLSTGQLTGPLRSALPVEEKSNLKSRNAPRVFLRQTPTPSVGVASSVPSVAAPFVPEPLQGNGPPKKKKKKLLASTSNWKAASSVEDAERNPARLVVMKKNNIAVLLVVRDEAPKEPSTNNQPPVSSGVQQSPQQHPSHQPSQQPSQAADPQHPPLSFYAEIDAVMSPHLRKLEKLLVDQTQKLKEQDEGFRFLYFNHMNLALKSTLQSKLNPLTMDQIKLIRSIHSDFAASAKRVQEMENLKITIAEKRKLLGKPGASSTSSSTTGLAGGQGAAAVMSPSGAASQPKSDKSKNKDLQSAGGRSRAASPDPRKSGLVQGSQQRAASPVTSPRNPVTKTGTVSSTGSPAPNSSAITATAMAALSPAEKELLSMERKYSRLLVSGNGTSEVSVHTRNGWVVGRRATQSSREFFVLIDDKVGNLQDIQEEVDRLAKSFFYNIFIH